MLKSLFETEPIKLAPRCSTHHEQTFHPHPDKGGKQKATAERAVAFLFARCVN